MISLRATTLDDLIALARQTPPSECELYREMTGFNFVPDTVAAQLFLAGDRRWTFADKHDRPVAVCGYSPVGNGTWRSWFLHIGEAWYPHGREVTARCCDIIAEMLADEYVQRLETTTLASRTRARAWYKRIGLRYESTACKASASGQDLVTYVALRA